MRKVKNLKNTKRENSLKKVSWIKNLKKIKKGPVVFFGNEFLDALPIKQFKKINNKVYERYAYLKKTRSILYLKKH